MSLRPLSLHSQTTGLTLPVVSQMSGVLIQHILHQRCLHSTYAEGIGEEDGRFQRPQLVDLDKSGGLSEAVDDMAGRHHFIVENIALMGQQRGHAGLDVAVPPVCSDPPSRPAHRLSCPAARRAVCPPDARLFHFASIPISILLGKNAPSPPDGEG